MKTLIGLALMLSLTVACTPPPTIVTTPGKTAFTADQIVIRVNELMNAAIAANTAKALDDATTKIVVQWTLSADQILAATPSGYVLTLQTSWGALQPQIAKIPQTSTVGIAIATLTALLGGLKS